MKTMSLLQSQAYNHIKDKILSGEFSPETIYSETKLASEIGISRTPMREALQCLNQDGYITIIPSKGFRIRQLTDEDMLQSIQVRCAIEGYCTIVIAQEIHTPKGKQLLAQLKDTLDEMEVLSKNALNDHELLNKFIDADHRFHMLLVEYVSNKEFNQVFQRLLYMIRLTSNTALAKSGRVNGTLQEHQDYYEALAEGSGFVAYERLINHLMMPIRISCCNDKTKTS